LKRIYLSSPHMGGKELHYVNEAFRKNWIAPLGANVDGFEKDLQSYTGRRAAAVVTSGTAALHLALILCGVEPGDDVLCQSLTFTASANPIRYQGANPVFIDSEPDTWNMDPELLEKAILERISGAGSTAGNTNGAGNIRNLPKAIIVVHLYGMPAKMDKIIEIGNRYGIPVIEDAAEALGSTYKNSRCGVMGQFSVLSFNGNKIITTSGGGALLSDEPDMIREARFLATQARDEAPHYQHSRLGYNYRMSNISAGIGRGQMKVLDKHIRNRRRNFQYYKEALNGEWIEVLSKGAPEQRIVKKWGDLYHASGAGIYFLKEPEAVKSNRWLTTILINPEETGGVTREDIRSALEKENIESRPLWKPMHLQPLYTTAESYVNGVSDLLFEHGLCLPSGSNLLQEDLHRTVSVIRSVLKKSRQVKVGAGSSI
jgi:dTDP-4-amino-4,6-dideoxygalactose transaminase